MRVLLNGRGLLCFSAFAFCVFGTLANGARVQAKPASQPVASRQIAQPGRANNPDAPPALTKYPRVRGDVRGELLALFGRGVDADIAAAYQATKLRTYLAGLSDGQLASMVNLLNTLELEAARIFVLKSYVAGEPWENLVSYAAEMRGVSEQEIIRRSTMRDDPDLIQQWQDSCGPSMLQTVAGEADPRYAWELNKLGDISKIDPLGSSSLLAQQQKEWLEQNGGQAVLRGQTGKGIPMTGFLNEALGPIVGATYVCQTSPGLDFTLNRLAELLATGYDVPLCIGWDESGTNNHFVVMLAVSGAAGARNFQVHDTWTGKTAWISETSIRQDRLSPIFDTFARLTHYYEPIPQ